MRFESVVELGGKTATGIPVPDEVIAALGGSKRPPVTVTLNGHRYRTTAVRMGGRFFVPLSAEHREAAGVMAGEEITFPAFSRSARKALSSLSRSFLTSSPGFLRRIGRTIARSRKVAASLPIDARAFGAQVENSFGS